MPIDGIAPLYVCGSHSNVVIMDCMLMEDRIAFEDEVRSLFNQSVSRRLSVISLTFIKSVKKEMIGVKGTDLQ